MEDLPEDIDMVGLQLEGEAQGDESQATQTMLDDFINLIQGEVEQGVESEEEKEDFIDTTLKRPI